MSGIRTYLVALTIVFLYFVGQLRWLANHAARREFLWQRSQSIVLIAEMLLGAALLAALVWTLRRAAQRYRMLWMEALLGHAFLFALLGGLMAAAPASLGLHIRPNITAALWIAGTGLIGVSLGRGWSRPVRYARNLCLIAVPTAFIVLAQMLAWRSWSSIDAGDFKTRIPPRSATPVYVLIFEEWSYLRSTDRDTHQRFLPFFENVRKLCEDSVMFSQAISPAGSTGLSIPRLLHQTHEDFRYADGAVYVRKGAEETRLPDRSVPSLFHTARAAGYNCYMSGWYNPYRDMLGDELDYCLTLPMRYSGHTLPQRIRNGLVRSARHWHDPLTRALRQRGKLAILPVHEYEYWHDYDGSIEEVMSRSIRSCPSNTFAVCHYRPAHCPYIWHEDGSYLPSQRENGAQVPEGSPDTLKDSEKGYMSALGRLDHCVGDVLSDLRKSGKYNDCLLVVTADHGWRFDPNSDMREFKHWSRRVPPLVKLPGQTRGETVDTEFRTNELRPLFEAVFAGERRAEILRQLLSETVASYVPEQGGS